MTGPLGKMEEGVREGSFGYDFRYKKQGFRQPGADVNFIMSRIIPKFASQ